MISNNLSFARCAIHVTMKRLRPTSKDVVWYDYPDRKGHGPTWGPPGSCGPRWNIAPWALLSGKYSGKYPLHSRKVSSSSLQASQFSWLVKLSGWKENENRIKQVTSDAAWEHHKANTLTARIKITYFLFFGWGGAWQFATVINVFSYWN